MVYRVIIRYWNEYENDYLPLEYSGIDHDCYESAEFELSKALLENLDAYIKEIEQ